MDTVGAPGRDPTGRGWGSVAHLPARVVACDQAQRWAEAGLPDELAELDVSLGAVWAGVQLAPWGAERQAPVAALALSAETAEQIIVITTEQLLTTEPKLPAGSLPADWR